MEQREGHVPESIQRKKLLNEEQIGQFFYRLKSLTLKIKRMITDKEPTEDIRLRYSDWLQSNGPAQTTSTETSRT